MKNILLWGGKSRSLIIHNYLQNPNLLNKKYLEKEFTKKQIKIKYIFDKFIKKINFKTKAEFSNRASDLKKYINNSNYFITCIGQEHGKARFKISKKLEKYGLKPINIVSKFSTIDNTSIIGKGNQIEHGAIIQCFSKIGDYCIINTSATIEHECIIGNGVHVMGGASIAGKVRIGNFVNIGTNSTILPGLTIEEGAFIGAGAVVTRNVKKNQVVIGNPAKFYKKFKYQLSLKEFKYLNI
jgi:sugar O-acyltransferase (sialic acid O-acetyltransferase NeuD family)